MSKGRARSCESKRAFRSAWHARRAMKEMIEKQKVIGDARIYPCRYCGRWHWGRFGGAQDRSARIINAIDRALSKDRHKTEAADRHTAPEETS